MRTSVLILMSAFGVPPVPAAVISDPDDDQDTATNPSEAARRTLW